MLKICSINTIYINKTVSNGLRVLALTSHGSFNPFDKLEHLVVTPGVVTTRTSVSPHGHSGQMPHIVSNGQ